MCPSSLHDIHAPLAHPALPAHYTFSGISCAWYNVMLRPMYKIGRDLISFLRGSWRRGMMTLICSTGGCIRWLWLSCGGDTCEGFICSRRSGEPFCFLSPKSRRPGEMGRVCDVQFICRGMRARASRVDIYSPGTCALAMLYPVMRVVADCIPKIITRAARSACARTPGKVRLLPAFALVVC